MFKPFVSFVSLVSILVCASPVRAQVYEAVGTRAQGMGGAFVAVADDATATWWNPAGLASGAYFSTTIERGAMDDPGKPAATGPARRDQASGFALALPSLGLSYYRFRVSEIGPSSSTATGDPVRQDPGVLSLDLRSLAVSRFGVTIGQSIGDHLVVASTLAVLRGGVVSQGIDPVASGKTSAQLLTDADNLDAPTETRGDIDLGAMVRAGSLKLGVNMKHVNHPRFGTGNSEVVLNRQTRAGLAFSTEMGKRPLTLAADVDLTKTPTVNGDAQHLSAGAEMWVDKRRFAVRAGASENLVGEKRTSTSAGLSMSVKTGVYLDGALTFGDDKTRSGWGLTLRATF